MSISDYLENELLDAVFSNGSFAVTTVYVSLHSGDPGETGAAEISGGSYARTSDTFSAAASGATDNDSNIDFTSMPSCSVSYVGCWDASSGGNFLWGGAVTGGAKSVNSGDTFRIAAGDLDVTLD